MTNNITNFSGEISKSRVILWAIYTAWKVSKYGVISGPYSPVFSPNTGKYGPEITPYLDTFHVVLDLQCEGARVSWKDK